ncbi:MAG: hypothetical protein JSR77_03300 [Planctomycetes bacterium]|nr:hypothetical protein [Planctomycetota bacterium]
MKTRTKIAALITSAIAGAGALALSEPPKHDDILGKPGIVASDADKDLKHTRMVGAYETPHDPGTSLMWCGTFQMAWNELANTMNGGPGPLRLKPDHPLAAQLNGSAASKADLDAASYVADSGFGRDGILERIKKSLADTFHGAASPSLLPLTMEGDDILAYAYLFKNLEFESPFIRAKAPMKFGDAKLKTFGLWHDRDLKDWYAVAKQVEVRDYQSPTMWAVELKSKSKGDRLIVARLTPGRTLADTCKAALAMKSPEAMHFEDDDTLRVPLMNFDATRSFNELVGKIVEGAKGAGRITFAKQNIRFRLDERGAVLKSEAAIGVTAAAPMRPKTPKIMVCDGPFLLLMIREDAANPYFAMWVDNPELLEKW